MKLSHKLFGALLLTLFVVISALVLSRYLFARNFKDYIHQVEIERLKSVVPTLQEEYRSHGGWGGIKKNHRYWRKRLRHEIKLLESAPQGELRKKRTVGSHRSGPMVGDVKIRYLLSDENGNPVVGKSSLRDKPRLVPITVDGKTVGWLGLTPTERFPKGPPTAFIQQQYRLYSLMGIVVLFITGIIAVLLTRHLVQPVKRLTEGTRALANRDFSVRIKETGSDEFVQLAEHFNSTAQTLQAYERMRKQWLNDISHELRTPIAILRGEIEALLEGVRQPTPENLMSLHLETLRIGKLVEDLHLISMADSKELTLNRQSISPVDILDKAIDIFRERFNRKKIHLENNTQDAGEIRICVDVDRFGQVFTNILENACKYMQSPGALRVSIKVAADAVCFIFEDSGPGVPEASLPLLFDRLYRVDSSRGRESGGSGLGLSVCKDIVAYHGGNIWAENNAAGGLTVGIRLPFEKK